MTLQAHSKEICVLGYFTALCSRQVPAQVGETQQLLVLMVLSTQTILKKILKLLKLISSTSSSTFCQIRLLVKEMIDENY